MNELQKLMDDIAEWSDATFGNGQRNPAIVHHLRKEIDELLFALNRHLDTKEFKGGTLSKLIFEYADCFMLLIDSASHAGVSADLLMRYTRKKLEINKQRKWGNPDKNGVVEHIKDKDLP